MVGKINFFNLKYVVLFLFFKKLTRFYQKPTKAVDYKSCRETVWNQKNTYTEFINETYL